MINPLDNIGPEELHIHDLLPRLKDNIISEIIMSDDNNKNDNSNIIKINGIWIFCSVGNRYVLALDFHKYLFLDEFLK